MNIKKQIERLVSFAIEHDAQPGEHTGGSGHLSYIDFSIQSISISEIAKNILDVNCNYIKEVMSEFSIEPDNPPTQSEYKKRLTIYLDAMDKMEGEEACGVDIKEDVNQFVASYLLGIEQRYGECRAPIKYPPYYYVDIEKTSTQQLYCLVDVDLGDSETLVFIADQSSRIISSMRKVFEERFGIF